MERAGSYYLKLRLGVCALKGVFQGAMRFHGLLCSFFEGELT